MLDNFQKQIWKKYNLTDFFKKKEYHADSSHPSAKNKNGSTCV
jgi:hypothetical protein